MRATLSALSLALGLCARHSWAQDSSSTGARLSFVRAASASDCIAAPALAHKVVQRMGRDPFTGPPRQWIEALVALSEGYYTVQLFERDREGRTLGTRELRAPAGDCHQLDDAMVLAIALIIDPTLQLAPLGSNPALAAPEAPSNGAVEMPSHPNLPPPALLTPRAPVPAAAVNLPTRPVEEAPATSRAVTAAAVAVYGVLPGVAAGAELVAQQALDKRGRYSLRWSALYLPETSQSDTLADVGYGLTAFEVGACMGAANSRLRWFACSALGAGAVHTTVHAPLPSQPGDRLWLALRLEAGVRLRLAGPLWAETRLFDLLAAQRWEFRVITADGPRSAFVQSAFMPGLALGLGLAL